MIWYQYKWWFVYNLVVFLFLINFVRTYICVREKKGRVTLITAVVLSNWLMNRDFPNGVYVFVKKYLNKKYDKINWFSIKKKDFLWNLYWERSEAYCKKKNWRKMRIFFEGWPILFLKSFTTLKKKWEMKQNKIK